MRASHLTLKAVAAASLAVASSAAFATNGMNMEAYGAKAGGMGGASMAYDNGNSAVMNNPATLVLGKEGSDFGIGFTHLGPDVGVTSPGGGQNPPAGLYSSGGDSYKMPSMSWIKKSGNFAYGAAMLAQGGMGTEYQTLNARSEVAFGRLMAPLAYKVNDQLSIAGQLDFVWGSMDMQSNIPGYYEGQNQRQGGRIDFSNLNAYTGAVMGSGFAGKVGFHYQVSKDLSVGATYHSKTDLSDLKGRGTFTDADPDSDSISLNNGNYYVRDFQWPETWGMGAAWNVTNRLTLAADYKRIGWSKTMDTVMIEFVGDAGSETSSAVIGFPQNWSDQDVYMIGAQYKVTDAVAVRMGYNYAKNPVPSGDLNYLFPAIVESHYTFGLGWQVNPTNSVAFSLTHAPEVSQTGNGTYNNGYISTHSQTTWRINYNYHF